MFLSSNSCRNYPSLHERANQDQQLQCPAQRQLFLPLVPQQPSGALQRFPAAAAPSTPQQQFSTFQDPYTGVLHSTAERVAPIQPLSTTSRPQDFSLSFTPARVTPFSAEQHFQSTVGRVLPATTNSQQNQRSIPLPTPLRDLISAGPLRPAPAAAAPAAGPQYGAQAAGPAAATAAPKDSRPELRTDTYFLKQQVFMVQGVRHEWHSTCCFFMLTNFGILVVTEQKFGQSSMFKVLLGSRQSSS
jgi:hypothetical protein